MVMSLKVSFFYGKVVDHVGVLGEKSGERNHGKLNIGQMEYFSFIFHLSSFIFHLSSFIFHLSSIPYHFPYLLNDRNYRLLRVPKAWSNFGRGESKFRRRGRFDRRERDGGGPIPKRREKCPPIAICA